MPGSRKNKFLANSLAICALICFAVQNLHAATVTAETLTAWNEHVQQLRSGLDRETCSPEAFLKINKQEKIIAKASDKLNPAIQAPHGGVVPVPSGLLHHWTGMVFIPGVRTSDLLAALQGYDSYASIFRPAVIDSKLLNHTNDEFKYRLKFAQKGFGVKLGLLGVFRSQYYPLSPQAGFSITEATELNELENPATSKERVIPFGSSHGYVEKMFTVVRYREVDTGIYVQVETLTLSRDIPGAVRWLVAPIIQRFSRQTMAGTLKSLKDHIRLTKVSNPHQTCTHLLTFAAAGERMYSQRYGFEALTFDLDH